MNPIFIIVDVVICSLFVGIALLTSLNRYILMNIGKGRIIGLILLVLLMMLSPVMAQGYSLIENDVEMRFNYPSEIKMGTCITISFWMKAKNNLTDLSVRLTLTYHADSYTQVVYDKIIVSETSVTEGWTTSKSINVCIPREDAPDPHLQADLETSYKVNGSSKVLEHDWYMSIVRSETYEELEEELEEARSKIDNLKDEIDDLKAELDEKEEALESLQEEHDNLLSCYQQLQSKYEQLEESYQDLTNQYKELDQRYEDLRDKHQQTLLDLERLRAKYDLLSRDYGKLDENYRNLLKDYENTLADLKTYRSMYQELKTRYGDLESRYHDALAEGASLRQRVADLESRYGDLSRTYQSLLGENILAKNVIFAQAAAVAAGVGIYLFVSRRFLGRAGGKPESANSNSNEGNSKRVQKILSGRRVTIPRDVAERLGLKEGDMVEIFFGDGHMIVKPIEKEASNEEKIIGEAKPEN